MLPRAALAVYKDTSGNTASGKNDNISLDGWLVAKENEDANVSATEKNPLRQPPLSTKPGRRRPLGELSANVQACDTADYCCRKGACDDFNDNRRRRRPQSPVCALAACGSAKSGTPEHWFKTLFAPTSGENMFSHLLLLDGSASDDETTTAGERSSPAAAAGPGAGESSPAVASSNPDSQCGADALGSSVDRPQMVVKAYPAVPGRMSPSGPPVPMPNAAHELSATGLRCDPCQRHGKRASKVFTSPHRPAWGSQGYSLAGKQCKAPLTELLWCDDCHCNSCSAVQLGPNC